MEPWDWMQQRKHKKEDANALDDLRNKRDDEAVAMLLHIGLQEGLLQHKQASSAVTSNT